MIKQSLFLFLCLYISQLDAQNLYSKYEIRDKFDDVIEANTVKSLIEVIKDSLIVVETKGSEPQKFKIFGKPQKSGSEHRPIHLIDDVYGYEETYGCLLQDSVTNFMIDFSLLSPKERKGNGFNEIMKKHNFVEITLRTIIDRYTKIVIQRVAWVRNQDQTRSIYYYK